MVWEKMKDKAPTGETYTFNIFFLITFVRGLSILVDSLTHWTLLIIEYLSCVTFRLFPSSYFLEFDVFI